MASTRTPLPPPTPTPTRCSVTVLPMLSLGAPMGVVTLRDLDPAMPYCDLHGHIRSHLQCLASQSNIHVHVLVYHVDLTLAVFPDQSSWSFLSRMPISQLFHRLAYPVPIKTWNRTPIGDFFTTARDVPATSDPPHVIHIVAEIVECLTLALVLPKRFGRYRRRLCDVDATTFHELQAFLSSAPEPVATRSSDRFTTAASSPSTHQPKDMRGPFLLTNVPAIAGLTLPLRKLMVRPSYEKLLDSILRELPDKKRLVYVAGTTGAGKTAFLWYVVHALCRRGRTSCGTLFAPPMDIVLDVPGLFVLIDTAGQVFTGPRGKCFRIELMKKETLYLVDLAHGDHKEVSRSPRWYGWVGSGDDESEDRSMSHQEGHLGSSIGHSSRILMCLPRVCVESNVATRTKFSARLLPPWKSHELELCRVSCFPALDASLVAARMAFWGRQPERTLAMDAAEGIAEALVLDRLGDVGWIEQIMDLVWYNFIKNDAPSSDGSMLLQDDQTRLFVLRSPLRDTRKWHRYYAPDLWRLTWCSLRVRDAVLQRVLDLQSEAASLPPILRHGAIYYMESIGWIPSQEEPRS